MCLARGHGVIPGGGDQSVQPKTTFCFQSVGRATLCGVVVQAARAREIAAEKKQAHVEYLAYHGMDGPRPCMYMGGKPI
eukprot:1159579-Pelagomonas_calceolata.AAC.8